MKFHQPRVLPLRCSRFFSRLVLGVFLTLTTGVSLIEHLHGATSITQTTGAADLGTTVTQNGHVYGISDGTPAGINLFHSFAQFSVATGDIAQFQTTNLLPNSNVSNILSRVTGGSPSSIFGTIDSITFYPNANLFLMNPNGIVFGPSAALNVGGSVAFTTANYLRLDGLNTGVFDADTTSTGLLTSASVAAFGFLGSNPAAISIQGNTLTVQSGQSISLVGGNQGFTYTNPNTGATATVPGGVTITGGGLSVQSGQINIASVASSGEVSAVDFVPPSGMTMGNISLSQGAMLDVSGNAAGTVRIRGGQLVIAESTISADTGNVIGASTAIDIQLTGDLSIANDLVPAITARTSGSGNAGEVGILASNLTATSNTFDILSLIDTHTAGIGKAGNVNITTNLRVTGSVNGFTAFIDSGTEGSGHGGNVKITAENVQIENSMINTGNFFANASGADATGSAGSVNIATDSLNLTFSQIETNAFSFANRTGQSGNITVTAHDINLDTSQFNSQGHQRGGTITITTDQLLATDSQIVALTNLTPGGSVTVTGKAIELSTGSSIVSSTGGDGSAGSITVTATDHLSFLGASHTDRPSGVFSNSFGAFGSRGTSGNIFITTPRLEMTDGARINSITSTSGHGGNVTINTMDTISMSGESGSFAPEPLFSLGTTHSGIFTRTIGGHCSGLCGDAGSVSINAGSLTVGTGAQIDTGTSTTGQGGDVTIHTSDTISLSGTLSDGSPAGIFSRTTGTSPNSGTGGDIALTAGQSVVILDGASVSASSTGTGNAGDILINAGQQFDMRDSSITTQATKTSGGNIDIQAIDRIRLVNSPISTSVRSGPGSGGNITIDPNVVVLQNSPITAQADRGAGGNITITTPLFIADSNSPVSASSQFGRNGTVTIQSPTSNLSESLGTLPSEPNQAHSLLTQRCAALANGQTSSFVVAGREQLPVDPGGWLSSPLAFAAFGESLDADHAIAAAPAIMPIAPHDTSVVSLRRLTPTEFLMANFADSEAPGCHS